MAAHSSILAWRIPWTEKPGRLRSIQSMELQRARHDWATNTHTHREEIKKSQSVMQQSFNWSLFPFFSPPMRYTEVTLSNLPSTPHLLQAPRQYDRVVQNVVLVPGRPEFECLPYHSPLAI